MLLQQGGGPCAAGSGQGGEVDDRIAFAGNRIVQFHDRSHQVGLELAHLPERSQQVVERAEVSAADRI